MPGPTPDGDGADALRMTCLTLLRAPEGEWVCLDARTRFGPPGTGLAESALWDQRGRIGRALQSLYIEPER